MSKGIIFYTDSLIREPIKSVVEKHIWDSGLHVTSVSRQLPLNFGDNTVVEGERGYPTYVKQILTALEYAKEDYVFFCEQDCLYPKSHFDFTPPRDDIFYYNDNVWRWKFESPTAVTYDRLICLSGLCCNRKLALDNYRLRMELVEKNKHRFNTREPELARIWGYEPGTKKKKRGGITDEDYETWKSDLPIIDIRHKGTFSPPKVTLDGFTHPPTGWQEILVDRVPGWNLRKEFNL